MKKFFNTFHITINSKLKFFILIIILFSLYIFISASSYVNAISEDIASSVFRLHVIANSDSLEDQNLKYIVRDKLLEYMNTISEKSNSKQDIIKLSEENSDKLQNIAKQVIQEQGYDYDVSIKIGKFYFPTKSYGDISFPSGNYDALRVEIGESKGQNWWCVMFPPLCFVDVTSGIVPDSSKEIIRDSLSEEEYHIISEGNNSSSNNNNIKLKFKLIELFQNSKIQTAKN